jgi:peptidoglycan/LPS O-acetylase OafA/YrhL
MSQRDLQLDFVKGFLVVAMVIYHTMNYFSSAGPEVFGYVRFVTGSFVLISGYIVTAFYTKKYRIDKTRASKRLVVRGLKLLTIFTSMNLIISLLGIQSHRNTQFDAHGYLSNLSAIYISGNSELTAFQILLPIAYVLIFSPLYILFANVKKTLITMTLILPFCYIFFNMNSYNLYLGILGLIGVSIGLLLDTDRLFCINNRLIIVCCFIIAITLMQYLDRNVLTYTIGILIILKLTYDFAGAANLVNWPYNVVILLGKYSLVCYIMQIIILHGWFLMSSRQKWGFGYKTISICLVTNILLFGLCSLLSFLRNRYTLFDRAYRIVFL